MTIQALLAVGRSEPCLVVFHSLGIPSRCASNLLVHNCTRDILPPLVLCVLWTVFLLHEYELDLWQHLW